MSFARARVVISLLAGLLTGAHGAAAQTITPFPLESSLDGLPSCDTPRAGQSCVITIDRQRPQSSGRLLVWNSTTVLVRVINKSPLEVCWSETLRPDLSAGARPDMLAGAFSRIATLGTLLQIAARRQTGVESGFQRIIPEAAAVVSEIEREGKRTVAMIETPALREGERALFLPVSSLFEVRAAETPQGFVRVKDEARQSLLVLVARIDESLPNLRRASVDANTAQQPVEALQLVQETINELEGARRLFAEFAVYLETVKPSESETAITLLGGRDETIADTVVCADGRTLQPKVRVPLRVAYTRFGGTNLSVGLLFSPMDRSEFEVQAVKDASVPGGVSYVIARQVEATPLPSLFVNFSAGRLNFGRWSNPLDITVGVGVDIMGKAATAFHFFTGVAAIRLGNVRLTPGAHLARQTKLVGGFNVNDAASESLRPPVSHGWAYAFALAVSYQLGEF